MRHLSTCMCTSTLAMEPVDAYTAPRDGTRMCPRTNPSFIPAKAWLSCLFSYSASSISSFPTNGIQTRCIIPVAALTCHCWYGLLLNYFINKISIKVPAINNASLLLTLGLQEHEQNKHPGDYSRKCSIFNNQFLTCLSQESVTSKL